MSKLAVLGDTHFGVRNDQRTFLDASAKFFNNIFWPTVDKEQISAIVHLGDLVDRRKFINFQTANETNNQFITPAIERQIPTHIIAGNHDVYFKNTNKVNVFQTLIPQNDVIKTYTEPTEVTFGDFRVLLLPWINDENFEQATTAIDDSTATHLFGHLELQGFEIFHGVFQTHGLPISFVHKFDKVLSGHYHLQSTRGNVQYVGSTGHYIWADYGDRRGFHIFDTEDLSLTFVENPYSVFQVFPYDDKNQTISAEDDYSKFAGCFVRLVVYNKTKPDLLIAVINAIENAGAYNVQVINNSIHIDDVQLDSEALDRVKDTPSLISDFVEQRFPQVAQSQVLSEKFNRTIFDLYSKALQVESV